MKNRGMLTEEIKAKSKELLGYEINQTELRLTPYVHHCLVNQEPIRSIQQRTNVFEWKKLNGWIEKDYISIDNTITLKNKKFWDFINEIMYLGYCSKEEGINE